MCGLVGIFNFESGQAVQSDVLCQMNKMIAHRGPDGEGLYVNGQCGLGHRRLAIIDLKSGHQPMECKQRGRVIVFNGEIYNFFDLRNKLEKTGIEFRTKSDTEVLLHLADIDDFSWLESLNGMFAFAFWDEKNKTLVLARDRLGIKPLYYSILKNTLVFSSEIKALLVYPGISRQVNENKIYEYIAFRSVAGDETLFKGIYEVPPGHVLKFRAGDHSPVLIKFWQEGSGNLIEDYTDITKASTDQFEALFRSSVQSRLISDVPLGTFNSGGVDSSLVTAMVKSMNQGELHTFSVGFEEPSYDESKYAQIVANKLGTNHHKLTVNEYDYSNTLETALWYLEEPINHPHTVQILLLSQLAKRFVTVVLTGEGADELYAGYPRYKIPHLFSKRLGALGYFAVPLMQLLTGLGSRRLVKILEYLSLSQDFESGLTYNSKLIPLTDYNRIISKDLRSVAKERINILKNAINRFPSTLAQLLYLDQRTYLPSLLSRLDKMTMAAGLEARVPFLDHNSVEWSYLIPNNLKIRNLTSKWIVKEVAKKWLPSRIVNRKKEGFGVPVSKWLRNRKGLGKYLSLLSETKTRNHGYFNPATVDNLVREHLSGRSDHSEALWGLINLELWHRMFIHSDPLQVPSHTKIISPG